MSNIDNESSGEARLNMYPCGHAAESRQAIQVPANVDGLPILQQISLRRILLRRRMAEDRDGWLGANRVYQNVRSTLTYTEV